MCPLPYGCYDAPLHGYHFLGKANSTHTFHVNYPYIIIATRSLFKLDAIKKPDCSFIDYETWLATGNVNEYIGPPQYIYGPPDGLTDDVGSPIGCSTGGLFEGYVLIHWSPRCDSANAEWREIEFPNVRQSESPRVLSTIEADSGERIEVRWSD